MVEGWIIFFPSCVNELLYQAELLNNVLNHILVILSIVLIVFKVLF